MLRLVYVRSSYGFGMNGTGRSTRETEASFLSQFSLIRTANAEPVRISGAGLNYMKWLMNILIYTFYAYLNTDLKEIT